MRMLAKGEDGFIWKRNPGSCWQAETGAGLALFAPPYAATAGVLSFTPPTHLHGPGATVI